MNFDNISYLIHGNERQRLAHSILNQNEVFSKLKSYDPMLVGTVPIGIDTENSDLDIICWMKDKSEFIKLLIDYFGKENNFRMKENVSHDGISVVARFSTKEFDIEIFGQNIPTKQQMAFRNLIIEHRLLTFYGESFRQKIIELKKEGYKTEQAFGIVLGLKGDPYLALLQFENENFEEKIK